MSIEFIKKDVTEVTTGVIAHGCNCQGVMGSGVAKTIRAKWPTAYERYHTVCEKIGNKSDLLGLAHIVNVGEQDNILFVANCFTQVYYGKDGKKYADLDAIKHALRYVVSFSMGADLPLYLPRIGCGLGGLDWDLEVGPALQYIHDELSIGTDRKPQIYVCDL